MSHTPGPWKFDKNEDGIIDIHDSEGNLLFSNEQYYPIVSHEADLRLIAAAPELLEALKDLVAVWGNQGDGKDYREYVKSALEAIRKAEGG